MKTDLTVQTKYYLLVAEYSEANRMEEAEAQEGIGDGRKKIKWLKPA